jgi:hypothetical protein
MVSDVHITGARVVVDESSPATELSPPLIGADDDSDEDEAMVVVLVVLEAAVEEVVTGDGDEPVLVVLRVVVGGEGGGVGAKVNERLLGQLVRLPVVVRNVPLDACAQRNGMNEPEPAPKQTPEPSALQ